MLALRSTCVCAAVRMALGPAGAALLIAGGVAYSVGGIIYAIRWPDPAPKCALPRKALHVPALL